MTVEKNPPTSPMKSVNIWALPEGLLQNEIRTNATNTVAPSFFVVSSTVTA
jgi:hypothetical protein